MKKFLIAPSIISAKLANLGKDIEKVILAGADILHFDVMDNHYVPNITMGPMFLIALREYGITVPVDVHLMVKPVNSILLEFIKAGANYITFHIEASKDINNLISIIKGNGCKVGLAFNPNTPLDYLVNNNDLLNKLDLILIMSVNPGYSGQSFIYSTLEKVRKASRLINKVNKDINLEVDGGVKIENIYDIAIAGANIFVSGTSIFKHSNYKIVISNMRKRLEKLTNFII